MNEPSVSVKNLTKSFSGRTVVDDLSFDVEKGEAFALLGHNGAGKSTTIDLILGLKEQGLTSFLTTHYMEEAGALCDRVCIIKPGKKLWKAPSRRQSRLPVSGKDHLTSIETISEFAEKQGADLTVMEDGEHWFHTNAQMQFLDDWIRWSIP